MGILDGKVAIVTGAGRLRSIGYSTSIALANLGCDVVVTGTGRNPDSFPGDEKKIGWKDIDSTADAIRAKGRHSIPIIADVTNVDDTEMMMKRTLEEFGRVDILINNAGMGIGKDRVPIVNLDPDVFQKVLDTKVRGTYLCSKVVVNQLLKQGEGGKIVTVASVAGKRGTSNNLSYNAANFAQVGITQSLAQELGPHGINVNCVCPGAVDTSRMDIFGRGEQWSEMASKHPIGRTGTPEEVGEFIAYLCTESASWITGQSINIDGGTVMEH